MGDQFNAHRRFVPVAEIPLHGEPTVVVDGSTGSTRHRRGVDRAARPRPLRGVSRQWVSTAARHDCCPGDRISPATGSTSEDVTKLAFASVMSSRAEAAAQVDLQNLPSTPRLTETEIRKLMDSLGDIAAVLANTYAGSCSHCMGPCVSRILSDSLCVWTAVWTQRGRTLPITPLTCCGLVSCRHT